MSAGLKAAALLGAVLGTGCVVGAESRPTTAESVDPPADPASPRTAQQLLGPNPGASAQPLASAPPTRSGQRWVSGYWHWTGVEYTWIPGHWEPAPAESGGG